MHQNLDALVRGKELELEQAAEAYRNLQWLKQQSEEKERNTLREKDTIINQLQAALQCRSQETQVTPTHARPFIIKAYNCCVNVKAGKPAPVEKPALSVSVLTSITDADTALLVCVRV